MIEVAAIAGIATVQDAGRPGRMHEGIPPGGALVPELLARANAAAGNAPGEAGIEIVGKLTILALAAVVLGTDDGATHALPEGESLTAAPGPGLCHYVALRGGVGVPDVLGGRGTLLVAGLGGLDGRALRRGDRLSAGTATRFSAARRPADVDRAAPVRVVLGPDVDRFDARAVDVLLGSTFTVDRRSDRVGIRLAGPRIPCEQDPAALSAPMIRGAIQVPPSGEPIVLGPDHPTTGGYPVIATVARDHLGPLAARAIGAPVRFVT